MFENPTCVGTEDREHGISQNNAGAAVRGELLYSYEEAIDLTGNGWYSIMLLATLSVSVLSMAVDIFGFSVIVSGASCDFQLGIKETGILLSATFVGPIFMAYPWGFVSDTQGRRKSLLISLWTSFFISSASAFSTNWKMLAVLKFISTSFSTCAQSTTFTFLGESCSRRFRDSYLIMMASVLDISLAIYVVIGYFILNMEFSYDLGFIIFKPWRLLSLILSTITGIGAVGMLFFYESPKFLLNFERHDEALKALAGIWRRNGNHNELPVKKLYLNEIGNVRNTGISFCRTLWEQIIPIFKPSLIWRSLQLYFFAIIVYGINNAYFIWLPYLGEQMVKNKDSNVSNVQTTVCSLITSKNVTKAIEADSSYRMDISLVWFSVIQGVSFALMTIYITTIAHKRRFLLIIIFLVSSLSGVGTVIFKNLYISFLMFLGVLANQLAIGVFYSYYVDLYPTSFRGMTVCLGSMVGRSSALGGVSLLGHLLENSCASSFYLSSVLMMGGALIAIFLPKDKTKQKN